MQCRIIAVFRKKWSDYQYLEIFFPARSQNIINLAPSILLISVYFQMKTAHPALVRGTCLKARAAGALAAPGLQKTQFKGR